MKVLHVAGAAALCAGLLLTGCAKKTTDQTTTSGSSTTDTTSATTAPGAAATTATAAPADASTATATTTTTASSSSGNGTSGAYIDVPVYPDAAEAKDQEITTSANGSSVVMKVYSTKDDPKRVAEWYKSHLPSSWKNGILTAGGKTVGTFSNEQSDGDQSVIVANQDETTTRIQVTTKHGK